jgi:hypothetical protein
MDWIALKCIALEWPKIGPTQALAGALSGGQPPPCFRLPAPALLAPQLNPILYDSEVLTLEASGTFWYSDTPEVPNSKWGCSAFPRIATWGRWVAGGAANEGRPAGFVPAAEMDGFDLGRACTDRS